MIDPLQLKQDVLAGCSPGTYLLPDGTQTQAACVLPDPEKGFSYPPSGTKTTGLELVISGPDLEIGHMYGPLMRKNNWLIKLVQWDQHQNLLGVRESVLNALQNKYFISSIKYSPCNLAFDVVESLKIIVSEYYVSN